MNLMALLKSRPGQACFVFSLLCLCSGQAQEVIFADDFESGRLLPGFWRTEHAEVVVGDAAKNQYSAKLKGGSEATLDLLVDLSGTNQAQLSFAYRDYGDQQSSYSGLWFSDDDGKNFTKVFSFHPELWCERWGYLPPFDVDELARTAGLSLTSRFVIRFRQESEAANGMGLDDVKVTRPAQPVYATLPFTQDFEGGLSPSWRHRYAFPNNNRATTPCGLVGLTSSAIFGVQSLFLGKSEDGSSNTNALDLHVNLAGHDRVVLQFSIAVLDEAEDTEDGVLLSDDGGETFVMGFPFKSWLWDMNNYGGALPPIELGRLARSLGLSLNDRFVIRFQQKGERDTSGSSEELHGIWIDNLSLTVPSTVYVRPPFTDGFELGLFGAMWAWREPAPTSFNMRNSGRVRVSDDTYDFQTRRTGNYGVIMTKEGFSGRLITANALDLHANLADLDDVTLSFYLKDFGYDTPDPEDAIYLSTDDGTSFVKLKQIDGAMLAGNDFRRVEIPLGQIADSMGLTLTSRCIIRFQQVDRSSPAVIFGETGFIIDDVSLSVRVPSATKTPLAVLPWVVNNSGFSSQLAVFNDGQGAAEVSLDAIDREGNHKTVEVTINPKTLFQGPASELFPDLSGYSLVVSSNSDTVYSSILTLNVEPASGGSSPSQTIANRMENLTSSLLFGYMPGEQLSAFVLVAPEVGQGSTPVVLTLYGTDGSLVAEQTVTLSANRPLASLLSSIFGEIPDHCSLKAKAADGIRLAGTTFVFNHNRQPSMTLPFNR